ncbi:phage DNA ejection protein [Escherichia albertii]|uniref:phage DNA ejection protein n=2 Tax=Gammaproteobacteria TaxID=1236 RepID=UPI0032B7C4D5
MADSNLNVPVIIQATRLDTSVLPRNIFSQSYLLYVIAQGTDVGNVANKANEAGQGAYDAQVRNDEQDVILADHEQRISAAEATLVNHEERISQAESTLQEHETRIAQNESDIASLDTRVQSLESQVSQGPEAYSKFITDNKDRLNRVGANADWMIQTGIQNPEQLSHMLTTMTLGAVGPDKMLDYQDKMVGRQLEKGRLDESIRQADMENARGWANIQNAQLDRAQRAQMHNDNVALKLQELGMKQQESGKIDPKLVRDLNSDINGFSKNYSAMRSAADNLQALGKRNTPAAQLGMIFNYMKSLDPQSVVREGEQVQVKRTDGIFGTLGNYVSQLSNGKMLNNEQVQDLINTSKLMANTEGEKFNQQMDDYLSTYGDSLPSGLTKQLQSRKAKLYEDIQQPAQQQTQQATSGGQTFREGMTAKNPKTGQKIIYRNGQWQPM